MRLDKLMTSDPKCCTPEMSIQEAAQLMIASDCGAIPVVESSDHTKPVGIITDRDIACRAVAQGKHPKETKVSDCMTPHLACVSLDTSVEECCEIMEKNQLRRLLVADSHGRLCGIVSQADIALHAARDKTAELVQQVSKPAEMASAVSTA